MFLSYFIKNVFVQILVFSFLSSFSLSCNITSIKRTPLVMMFTFEILKEYSSSDIVTQSKFITYLGLYEGYLYHARHIYDLDIIWVLISILISFG